MADMNDVIREFSQAELPNADTPLEEVIDRVMFRMTMQEDQYWRLDVPHHPFDPIRLTRLTCVIGDMEENYRFIEMACRITMAKNQPQPHTPIELLEALRDFRDETHLVFQDAAGMNSFRPIRPHLDEAIALLGDVIDEYDRARVRWEQSRAEGAPRWNEKHQ